MACLSCHPSAGGVLVGPDGDARGGAGGSPRGPSAPRASASSRSPAPAVTSRAATTATEPRRTPGARLKNDACTRCHKGYFVGWDYQGRAPREDHARYQRGAVADGEPYLKMLPDVHAERGMTCAACHTMRSLQEGKRAAKTCRECHPAPSRDVPEHSFSAHLEKMECEACHAAWAPQEYGTFLVRAHDARAGGGLRAAACLGSRGARARTSRARTRRRWG